MILNLPNLGVKGINTDVSPWDLPDDFLSDGLNFRLGKNAIIAHGGYKHIDTPAEEYVPAYAILARTEIGTFVVSAGSKIYSYSLDYNDISGDVNILEGSEYLWSGCNSGSIVVLNNKDYYPVYWDGGDSVIDLPWNIYTENNVLITETWKDKGYSAKVIRSHKNFLIALNLEDTEVRSDSFRWSHPADTNGIPFTWDPDNTSGIAGVQPLGGDGGQIIDGLSLRDSFVIYSEKAINVIDLSGDEFVWRVRDLSATVGLLSKDCVVEVKGLHYFITQGDIVTFDGNNIVSISHDVIQTRLKRLNTNFANKSFTYANDKRKEIWFCIPDDDNEDVSVALIYNWKINAWSVRELPQGTGFIVAAPEITDSDQSWDGDTENWDEDITRWSFGISDVSFSEKPYAVNHSNSDLQLLDSDVVEQPINTYLERTDLALNGQIGITTLTRLYPHVYGANKLRIRVGSQDRAGGAIRWKAFKDFDPDKDRKIDVRTTGALHCYRVESIDKGVFRFAGLDIEYEADGIR